MPSPPQAAPVLALEASSSLNKHNTAAHVHPDVVSAEEVVQAVEEPAVPARKAAWAEQA